MRVIVPALLTLFGFACVESRSAPELALQAPAVVIHFGLKSPEPGLGSFDQLFVQGCLVDDAVQF